MKLTLYRMATSLGGPFIRYYLNNRLKAGKEDAERFDERLGIASLPRPTGKLMWIHAASVGESLAALPLIERLNLEHPEWQVLITTGTVTSACLMIERLPSNARHQFVPVDRVSYVRHFLEHWKPDLALWMESEFWPNLVIETRARAVPMVVLNGRMSERSFKGWMKHKSMMRRILFSFRLIMAQSETDGARFTQLGAKTVTVPGNIKFSGSPLPVDVDDFESLARQIGERPVWLASSTHDGEEVLCGRIHAGLKKNKETLLTLIVPRHPQRGKAVAAELKQIGLNVSLRSAGQDITDATDIYIADTMGELGLFYRLCEIVYIGKTLLNGGGQNPIEAALLDCALIFGPDMSNFSDVATKLLEAKGAITVQNEAQLSAAVQHLLDDANVRSKACDEAHTIATSEAHVLNRIMIDLAPYLTFEESH